MALLRPGPGSIAVLFVRLLPAEIGDRIDRYQQLLAVRTFRLLGAGVERYFWNEGTQRVRAVFVLLDRQTPSRLLSAFPAGVAVRRVGLAEAVKQTRAFLTESLNA